MSDSKTITVELLCDYAQWWRYNVMMTCGCFDAEGSRTAFCSGSSEIAPVGSNLKTMPEGVDPGRRVRMEIPGCDNFRLFLYIIPHTLPEVRFIEEAPAFPLVVRIMQGRKVLQRMEYKINQWSGASIEVDFRIP